MLLKLENMIFDDFTIDDGEQMTRWTQVCESHSQPFKDNKTNCTLSSCAGEPICGVDGCEDIAEYYLDFIDGDYREITSRDKINTIDLGSKYVSSPLVFGD